MTKTNKEKMETITRSMTGAEKEIRQLENRVKRLSGSQSQLERKERARRLIERGAMLENIIPDAKNLTNEQIQSILFAVFCTPVASEALRTVRESTATNSSLM